VKRVCTPCSPFRYRERKRKSERDGGEREGERVASGSAIASRKCGRAQSVPHSVSMRDYYINVSKAVNNLAKQLFYQKPVGQKLVKKLFCPKNKLVKKWKKKNEWNMCFK
jgi:hypothetical protein